MQIKLVDGTIYDINDMKIENGTLYIEFADKSAEEVQTIISNPANLGKITLLEDVTGTDLAYYDNFTISAGVLLSPDSKVTGMLNQEREDTTVRLQAVEVKAGEALTLAQNLQTSQESIKTDVEDTKKLAQESVQPAKLSLAVSQIIAQDFEDADAVTVKNLYPEYTDCIGKTVSKGFKMNHEGVLYKVIQPSLLIQEQYVPGEIGMESLYTVIDEVHQGTMEDPIPYSGNMELESGKYYKQNNIVYRCTRNTEQPVYHNLSDLVGIYVEVAQ